MLRLSAPLILCAALAAQTSAQPAPNRFVPADSFLVVRTAAPAKWKQRFAKTQMAKLFQSPSLEPMLAQVSKALDEGIERIRTTGKLDADLIQSLVRDYAGDITVAMQLDWDDLAAAMAENRPPAVSMIVTLSPDGAFDLASVAAAVEKAVDQSAENRRPMKDLSVGDVRLRITADADTVQASVPAIVDGQLVMLFANDLEHAAPKMLAAEKRFDGAIGEKALYAHAHLAPAVSAFLAAIDEQAGAMIPFDLSQVFSDLGLSALDSGTLSIDATDKRTLVEMEVNLGSGDPGLFGALLVEAQPKMMRLVPANAEAFNVSHLDISAIYSVVAKVWEQFGDQIPMTMEDAESAFAEACKVRLKEDLLAHLGQEIVSLQSDDAVDPDEEEAPTNILATSCFAVALKDAKAFGQSLETLLRSRGMHAARKTEEYADQKIHRLRVAGLLEVEYAVTDDALLLVIGKNEGSSRNLRAILDAKKQGGEGPAILQKVVADAPTGWTGVSVSPVSGLFSTVKQIMKQAARNDQDARTQVINTIAGMLDAVVADAKQLGIEHAVSTTYATPRSLRTQIRL